jgi:predicted nucleic acid-binding protein
MMMVDSNVIIYAELGASQWRPMALRALADVMARPEPPWLSRQVLRECLAALTRPQQGVNPPPLNDVLQRLRLYEQTFQVAEDSAEVTRRLYDLVARIPVGGKQIHDANLVATMLAHGIGSLLTHNAEDFERFESLIEVVPLSAWAEPAAGEA